MSKDKFAPENAQLTVSFGGQATVHNCRMAPEKGRGPTAVSIGGFETTKPTVESNPR